MRTACCRSYPPAKDGPRKRVEPAQCLLEARDLLFKTAASEGVAAATISQAGTRDARRMPGAVSGRPLDLLYEGCHRLIPPQTENDRLELHPADPA
eukprot:scaffold215341_cov30-Tisochrysis_lutea.AAC.9